MRGKLVQFFASDADFCRATSAADCAFLEERYIALRRQVPVIYVVAIANLCGLMLATDGVLAIGLNFPTLLTIFAVARIAQWHRAPELMTPAKMRKRLDQTVVLAAILCSGVSLWCLHLVSSADASTRMAVILFGGMTAIGAAYGLSVLPIAAPIPIVMLALPLAGSAMVSRDPQLAGAALSLALVACLILRILFIHNARFAELIRSRTMLVHEQAMAERARQEAVETGLTDFLTGLPNRRAFVAALDATVVQSTGTFAVAILDLNNFKFINDTLGHFNGDALLQTVAARLDTLCDKDMFKARLGGDEFGFIFRNLSKSIDATSLGLRILAEVGKVASVNGREVSVGASIGFGFSRFGTVGTPSRVLTEADLALYEAKRSCGANLAIFEAEMEAPHERRSYIEQAVRSRNFKERVHLVYQPIFDLKSGVVVAVEALARWEDEKVGKVSPSEFVPIAEKLDVINELSHHLLKTALCEASRWPENIQLSFNLSGVQLSSYCAAEVIIVALNEADFSANRLQVEVTETALLSNFSWARENLTKLKKAGVRIVLDDFGAGYSSIGYLRELSFDQIKLDGILIRAGQETERGRRLLLGTIGLCHALGVTIVAEHIENEEQRCLVLDLGCTEGQGFWLEAPLSATAIFEYLNTTYRRPWHAADSRYEAVS